MSGSFLSRSDLRRSFLSGSFLSRSFLSRSYLRGSFLSRRILRQSHPTEPHCGNQHENNGQFAEK
ncbi:MAG: pentapeptide repeat-containing protein [Planctomycetaceae bacterium]|nr:pentapeptide repeat-containing protein [Planctomycetaceae bacterium]